MEDITNKTFKYLNPSVIFNPKYDNAGILEDEEEGFSKSIKENGVYDPIVVSVSNKDPSKYQIITGRRRLHYAKIHRLTLIPCIIWKNASNTDIALAELVQVAHRRAYTDTQKARTIAAIYETVNIPASKAIQFVKQMHNDDYKQNKFAKAKNQNLFRQGRRTEVEKPTPEFMELFEKVGYSASRQYTYLQLITQLEPEVLEHAEKRGLPMQHKTLLTHSQLKKSLREKGETAESVTSFKKNLANKIAGKPYSEARNIVHDTIAEVRDEVEMRKIDKEIYEKVKDDPKFQSMVREGRRSSIVQFMNFTDGADKLIKAITNDQISLHDKSKQHGWEGEEEIPDEILDRVIKTHSIEIIKNMKFLELHSTLRRARNVYKLLARLIPIMEEEEENMNKKEQMLGR